MQSMRPVTEFVLWRCFHLAVIPMIFGCVVEPEKHYRLAPNETEPREVQIGGMATDQIVSLWESTDKHAADTLDLLRQLTDESPIVVAPQTPISFGKTPQELWNEAIQPGKKASFNAALRAVSRQISERSLCLQIRGTAFNRRVTRWSWCSRDFLGEPLKHMDEIENEMPRIVVAEDRVKFAFADTNQTYVPYGLIYGTPLLQGNWVDDWAQLEQDFSDMRSLGANCVRVHLQFGEFMDTPTRPNQSALKRLRRLLSVAEREGLYLDITGLNCFVPEMIPRWYDKLNEARRWNAQAVFWSAVARTCARSNAVFCYDLMNEPVFEGGPDSEVSAWLVGEGLGGYYFVQRIARELKGRTREQIAKAWVDKMVFAIRQHDPNTLVTVGVIPFALNSVNGRPVFYGNTVDANLDFASIHVYPNSDKHSDPEEMDALIERLSKYDVGMPLFIEETSSFRSGNELWGEFLDGSTATADGWLTQFFGTPKQLEENGDFLSLFRKYILDFWILKQSELVPAVM